MIDILCNNCMIIYEYCILDGVIPYDGIPIKEFVAVAIPVTVIYVVLASTGIIFAMICLVFNYMYRNKK